MQTQMMTAQESDVMPYKSIDIREAYRQRIEESREALNACLVDIKEIVRKKNDECADRLKNYLIPLSRDHS